jgi:hypothetical protein
MRDITLANGATFQVFESLDARCSPLDGKLRTYTSVGSYPVFYLDGRDNLLCAECASEVIAEYEDGEDIRGLPKVGAVNWEDPSLFCDCGERIESAYAEED